MHCVNCRQPPKVSVKDCYAAINNEEMAASSFTEASRAAWKQTANRLRGNETWGQMARKVTVLQRKINTRGPGWERQTHAPSAYLHQSCRRRRGYNILPPLHWLLPGSTNSHSWLLCISAYSLNTWLASEEESREQERQMKGKCFEIEQSLPVHQRNSLDEETGRDGLEILKEG